MDSARPRLVTRDAGPGLALRVGVSGCGLWERAVRAATGEEERRGGRGAGAGIRREGWHGRGSGARVCNGRRSLPRPTRQSSHPAAWPALPQVAWGRSRPRPPLPESRGYPSRTSRRSRGGGGGPGLILHLHHGCSSSCYAPLWLFPLLSNCFVN